MRGRMKTPWVVIRRFSTFELVGMGVVEMTASHKVVEVSNLALYHMF